VKLDEFDAKLAGMFVDEIMIALEMLIQGTPSTDPYENPRVKTMS
jgi:hypothetical protein